MDKLNLDCVRDMILLIENRLKYKSSGKVKQVHMKHILHLLDTYSNDELCEATKYLAESKLVTYSNYKTAHSATQYWCDGITPLGHKFIEQIRDDTIWNKVKKEILPHISKGIEFILKVISALLLQ